MYKRQVLRKSDTSSTIEDLNSAFVKTLVSSKGRKPQRKGVKTPGISKEQLLALRKWLFMPDNYEFMVNVNSVSAFPNTYFTELSTLDVYKRQGYGS